MLMFPFHTHVTSDVASRITIDQLAATLRADVLNGLSNAEANSRLHSYGHNELKTGREPSVCFEYLRQFTQPMIMLLLVSAIISMICRQFDDAISITCAVIIVVSVGFVQEYRSEKALAALNRLLPTQTRCIRQGCSLSVASNTIVPGDVIMLDSGDRVPADARLLSSSELLVDESSFTGESEYIVKSAVNAASKRCLCMLFAGSTVRQGFAKALVVATGEYSEFGTLLKSMRDQSRPETPLQIAMDRLSRQISLVSVMIILFIVAGGFLFAKHSLRDVLSTGVSLAVAAIPEGLPVVVTVTLALGVMRMAKHGTVVRHIQSMETMGRVDVMCFDKTGTLSQNKMCLKRIVAIVPEKNHIWTMPDDGELNSTGHTAIEAVVEAALLCSNVRQGYSGQPTETAIWTAAKHYFPRALFNATNKWVKIREWPFSSDKRWMAVSLRHCSDGVEKLIMKGAVEIILEQCVGHACVSEANIHMENMRTLAIAEGSSFGQLQLLGLVGLHDPLRESAPFVCQSLVNMFGITPIIITGDAEGPARYIANQVGLGTFGYQSGDEVEKSARVTIKDCFGKSSAARVFYRTTPRQKLGIVRALQRQGSVVAMVGDGINDAIALRAANVGISLVCDGTDSEISDVNKEAADVILLNADLSNIIHLIAAGQSIFLNIQNFIRFQLSTTVAALSIIALGTLLKGTPLNAMQILWINIIMDGPPAQSLGVEPMNQKWIGQSNRKQIQPVDSNKSQGSSIIGRDVIMDILMRSFIIIMGTLLVYVNSAEPGETRSKRQTTLTFTCFVLFDMFNAVTCRSRYLPIWKIGFLSNPSFCAALIFSLLGQLLVIYWPPLQYIFQTESLAMTDLLRLTLIASSVFAVSEIHKYLNFRSTNNSRLFHNCRMKLPLPV